MQNKGMLLVITDAPAAIEDELNAWYDTDHIPERLAIPGFESALRFVSADRARRYLALYDLTRVEVLATPEYLAFSGVNFTPWTRRIVTRCRVDRVAAIQSFPGDAATVSAPRLLLVRLDGGAPGDLLALARTCFDDKPNVLQWRAFRDDDTGHARDHLLVAGHGDLAALLDPAAIARTGVRLQSVETYLPY